MRRIASQLYLMLACIALLGYFIYHGMHGKHGYYASHGIEREAAELQARLDVLNARKAALEHRISLMLPESLDPDMLDERARQSLNFAHPNDLILLRTPE